MRVDGSVSINAVRDYYNKFTSHLRRDLTSRNGRLSAIRKFLDQHVLQGEYFSALDIGCGVGITSEMIRNYATVVSAIDLSDENIATAKGVHLYSDVTYQQGDFATAQLGVHDLVCAFDVVEHIRPEARDQFMANMHACCGELALVTVPKPETAKRNQERPKILQIVDEVIEDDVFDLFTIKEKVVGGIYVYYVLEP